jgi:hypothetical protein
MLQTGPAASSHWAKVASATVLIRDCSFKNVSTGFNDIASENGANVTFVCPAGYTGDPVQMNGTHATVIPPKELKCTKAAEFMCVDNHCVPTPGGVSKAACTAACG